MAWRIRFVLALAFIGFLGYTYRHQLDLYFNPVPGGIVVRTTAADVAGRRESDHRREQSDLAEGLAMQMAQPLFAGNEIAVAFIGDPRIALQRYRTDTQMLYFSIDQGIDMETLYAMVTDRDEIRVGKTAAGTVLTDDPSDPVLLDDYVFRGIDQAFIGLPVTALNAEAGRELTFNVNNALFDPTIAELVAMNERGGWYAGHKYFVYQDSLVVNHAGMVVPDDPALTRLTQRLTQGAATDEERVQRLLDFVTAVVYDEQVGYLATETMRNPYQTIAMNLGDCGNKVILFASLLEQIDVDYQLVYVGTTQQLNHILVAVYGDFSRSNGLHYTDRHGDEYFLAETTATGFQIGISWLENPPMQPGQTFLVQEPGRDGVIHDRLTDRFLNYY